MEAAGLITRRVDHKDNPYTLVTLAPAEQQRLQKMEGLGETFEIQHLDGLCEEEQATLVQVLERIKNNLSRLMR